MAAGSFVSCNDTGWPDRDNTIVNDLGVESLAVWPPLKYALPGDVLTVEVAKLKTVYTCARVLSMTVTAADSGAFRIGRLDASAELPGTPECPLTPGLDTTLTLNAPAAGITLLLRTPSGANTDTVRVLAGTATVEGFTYIRGGADTVKSWGRFVFRDSTAGYPLRTLRTDSLETCEVLQAAVFRRVRDSDTLSIAWRTLNDASSPSCTGHYADTVTVVQDKYGFP